MKRRARQHSDRPLSRNLARLAVRFVVFGGVAAWILSRLLTDLYAWSQPIWWVPSAVLLAPVWGAGVWAAVRWRVASRHRRRRGRSWGRRGSSVCSWWRSGVFALAMVSMLVVAFGEMGLYRSVIRPAGVLSADAVDLRVVFWNQAGREAGDIAPVFVSFDPTVFVLSNRHSATSNRDLVGALLHGGDTHRAMGWPFDLFSRLPILRWGTTSLGLDGHSRSGDGSARTDSGWAAWYELDTAAGPLVVWAIDLPSDPRAHRVPMAREAGRSLATWQGAMRVADGDSYRFEQVSQSGFPAPDIVVGDFNIPRRSASLRVFLEESGAGGMRDTFREAGYGLQRTWPREWPVWAIDHCFLGPRVSAIGFDAFDPQIGGHRALVVDLAVSSDTQTD